MNQKGQLFTIDLLLAFGIILLGVGLQMKMVQNTSFDQHEQINQIELETVGQTALILLVTNPENTCEVWDTTRLFYLKNCVATEKVKTRSKSAFGIPDGYGYQFIITTLPSSILDTMDDSIPPGTAPNLYVTHIDAMMDNTASGQLSKAQLDNCQQTGCPTQQKTISIKIWRIP